MNGRARASGVALALVAGCAPARPRAPSPAVATVIVPAPARAAPDAREPDKHDGEGTLVPEQSLPAPLDASQAPAAIVASERAIGVRAVRLEPQNPRSMIEVGCSDARCWMLPGGDRGGQSLTFLRRGNPNSGKAQVELASALRLDERSAALELREAWVDKTTLGTRLARTSRLPLMVMGQAGSLRVYAFRQGEQVLVLVPLAGAVWAFDDARGAGDVDRYPVTSCDLALFPREPSDDAHPLLLFGPLKTQTSGEPVPYSGPQLRVEIRVERAAADPRARIRVTSEPWSARTASGG